MCILSVYVSYTEIIMKSFENFILYLWNTIPRINIQISFKEADAKVPKITSDLMQNKLI